MTTIVSTTAPLGSGNSYIGYNNILETGTVTVTSEATGFPKENAYDWLPWDYWKASAAGTVYLTVDMGTATDVDYWALAFHDLADHSGTIKPQYSSNGSSWSDLDTVQGPADNKMIFRPVTSVRVRYYRFEISSTTLASAIGALSLGQHLRLERGMKGFTTPYHGRNKKILNSIGETGNPLGSTVYSLGQKFTISQENVSTTWVDANWESLIDHIEIKRFFFMHDYENAPSEVAFCWTDKISHPRYNNDNLKNFSIDCHALI